MALRGGLLEQEGSAGAGFAEYTLVYRIEDVDGTASVTDVLSFVSSSFGHSYGVMRGAFQCQTIKPKQDSHPKGKGWTVDVNYSTQLTGPNDLWDIKIGWKPRNKVIDTALAAWKFHVDSVDGEGTVTPGDNEAAIIATNPPVVGKKIPIVNSYGDAYDPPLEQEENLRRITLIKHVALPSGSDQLSLYNDTMNKADTMIAGVTIPAYCGLIHINQQRVPWLDSSLGRSFIIQLTIEIDIRPETWRRSALDQGMNAKSVKDGTTTKKSATSPHGERGAARARKLNGAGDWLSPTENPVYNGYFTYLAQDWGALNLPGTLDTAQTQTSGPTSGSSSSQNDLPPSGGASLNGPTPAGGTPPPLTPVPAPGS